MILPIPLRSGYSQETNNQTETFTPDSGYRRVRRLYSTTSKFVLVKWKFSNSEYGLFETWFNDEIGAGSVSFSTRLIEGTETVANKTVKFTEELYTADKVNDSWIVSAKLEVIL